MCRMQGKETFTYTLADTLQHDTIYYFAGVGFGGLGIAPKQLWTGSCRGRVDTAFQRKKPGRLDPEDSLP